MALDDNSYGTVEEVGALCPLYATASGQTFDGTTRPTLTQVEKFVDRVSSTVNVLLAEAGFAIPVSQDDAARALADFVVLEVVALVEYANGAGPFIPTGAEMRAATPTRRILRDAEEFVGDHAAGFERLGATRTYSMTDGLECRREDDAGDDIEPMFQRKMMGNTITDWDTNEDD